MRFDRGLVTASLVLAALGACAPRSQSDGPVLMNIAGSQRGPDEFSILPNAPLQAPPSFSTLPTPTPGGRNLVEPDPQADAVAAMGGRPSALRGQGGAGADGALLSHAGRYGTDPTIRESLAAEDLALRERRRGRVLERLFGANVYQRAYRGQALDRDAELERWRAAGARTPAAPPPER